MGITKKMKWIFYQKDRAIPLLLICLFLFCTNSIYANSNEEQQSNVEIRGRVVTDNGSALPGVSVKVKDTSTGTITDGDGLFTIKIPSLGSTLVFSFITFETQEIRVNKEEFLAVTLYENVMDLEEAVVIGYQAVTKREIHGAVSSITMKDIEEISAPSVDVMLQGMIPGMNIQTNSGAPGAKTSISIRGNTSLDGVSTGDPLIVLDGIPVDPSVVGFSTTNTNYFSNINPSDIESIHVLKDASGAAIYGSRAANGVIQIVTKRGKSGKPRVSFNGSLTLNTIPPLPKVYAGVTERRKKLELFESTSNHYNQLSNMPIILTDSLNPAFNNNTDWFGMYYQNSWTQDYNISISGGDEHSNYRISGGYLDQQGTIKGTGLDRYSFTGNFNNNVSILSFNTYLGYTTTKTKTSADSDNTATNALSLNLTEMPSSLLYLNDTDKAIYTGQYSDTRNDNSDESFRFSEYVTARLTSYLLFNTQFSYSTTNSRLDYFSPSIASRVGNAYARSSANKSTSTDWSAFMNLDKYFGTNHHLMGVVGIETQKTKYESTYAYGSYLTTDDVKVVSGVSQDNMNTSSDFTESALAAYFARAQYFFKDRYSVSASIRRDGASKFASDKRWGYFPSASAFWIISDENFMDWSRDYLSMWKFRVSYGETGTHPSGSNYGYLSRYTNPGTYDGNVVTTPDYGEGIAQRDFTWEKTKEWNVGMDVEIGNGRYFFQADVYNRESDGLYYRLTLPKASGYDQYYTNAVGVRNSGVELSFRANNVLPASAKDWNLMFAGNISYNKNQIMKLPHNNRTIIENGNRALSVGSPINMFYMAIYDGVFSSYDDIPVDPYTGQYYKNESGEFYKPGDAYWRDVDGNYQWVSYRDRDIVGDPNPKWTGGINSSLRYKNWMMDIFCSFTLNRDIWNQSSANTLSAFIQQGGANEYGVGYSTEGRSPTGDWRGPKDYIARRMLVDLSDYNFWQKEGDNSAYPSNSIYNNSANFYSQSSMFLENGSYFKINNITLSYMFPNLRTTPFQSLRLSLSAQNVAIIKNCKAADPQNVSVSGIYTGNGYGLARSFIFKIFADF